MKVLKATPEQRAAIESHTTGNHLIKFVKDANGNWIVGKEILNDPNFKHLKSEFAFLEEIEYQPPQTDI